MMDRARVAELIVTGSDGRRRGSGYRVTRDAVLTAAHVVEDAVSVEVRFEPDLPGQWVTAAVSWWADPRTDIALLVITPRPADEALVGEAFSRLGDRAGTVDVEAVGFPRWKMRSDARSADSRPGLYRDSSHVTGSVATWSNWREGTLEVALSSSPGAEPGSAVSPWEGMSGAALWAGNRIIGVISKHHPGDGTSTLAAVRIECAWEVADPRTKHALLDVLGLPEQAAKLPVVTATPEVAAGRPVEPQVHNTIDAPVHGSVVQAGTIGEVHYHSTFGRSGWWMGEILVGVVMLAALAVLIVAAGRAQWTSMLGFGLVLAAGFPALWWLVGRSRRAASQESVPDEAITLLRNQVCHQWRDERGRRRLQQPRPLQLRWRPTSRPVQVRGPNGKSELMLQQGELLQNNGDHRPAACALVDAVHQSTRAGYEQMVLLGEPGSGKSTLALLFTLAAIEGPDPLAPVPVLLTVAGWNPREPIEHWIARRISDDYPALSRRQAMLLLKDRRILPVLDGLDEIHAQRLDKALQDLDRSAGSGLQALITCRSYEYEQTVRKNGALSRAAVIEIDPIDIDSAKTYLEEPEIQGSNRWAPVIAAMEHNPGGKSARLLSTPLMIDLARRVYHKPDSRPQTLTDFPTVEDAEHHLLDQLIPSAYEDERQREKARRWLAFLAHHLHDRMRSTNFEWWHLAQAVPRWVVASLAATITGIAAIPLLVLIGISEAAVATDFPLLPVLSTTILAVAVMVGLHSGRSAHTVASPAHPVRTALGGVLRDLVTFITAFGVIGANILLIGHIADPRASDAIVIDIVVSYLMGPMQDGLLVVGVVVVAVSSLANVLNVRHGGMPQRSAPRLRTLLPNLAVGTAVGLLIAAPTLFEGGFEAGLNALLIALTTGLPLGVACWLTTPDSQHATSSPSTVLRKDRTALFAAASVSGGASIAVIVAFVLMTSESEDPASDLFTAWPLLGPGYVGAVIVLFCSGNAWISYTIARLWLAARGRLPWRLLHFLRTAHKVELLRQVGAAYQLRHDRLRTHLAKQWTTEQREAGFAIETRIRHDPWPTMNLRTTWRVSAATASIGMLFGVVTFLYPSNAPRTATAFTISDVGNEEGVASSLDGNTIAIVGTEGTAIVSKGQVTRLPAAADNYPAIVALSPNGDLLALSTVVSPVQVWNTRTGQRVHIPRLSKYPKSVMGVAFSRDGNVLATSDESSRVQMWDVNTGKPIQTFSGIASSVSADEFDDEWQSFASFSPDLRTIVTYHEIPEKTSAASSLIGRIWDVRTGTLIGTVPDPECPLGYSTLNCRPVVTSDGRVRMVNPDEGTVEEVSPGRPPRTIDLFGIPVYDGGEISLGPAQGQMAFSPDGRTLLWVLTWGASSTNDGPLIIEPEVYTWDIARAPASL